MHTAETVAQLHARLSEWRRQGCTIALVPTMGNLHTGHTRLVEQARRLADRVVVSVFVNPIQFAPEEDFSTYPRTPVEDECRLTAVGTDLLFRPSVTEMLPAHAGSMSFVDVPILSGELCGAVRPGHFRGVATLVCRLFNLTHPDVAVFGEKDYQQLLVIRRMVEDLGFPIRIVGVATVREADGLAMSSRNAYLDATQRAEAPLLARLLRASAAAIQGGERNFPRLEQTQMHALDRAGWRPDYFTIRDAHTLAPATPEHTALRILAAAWLGRARLIDNLGLILDRSDGWIEGESQLPDNAEPEPEPYGTP